LGAKMTKCNEIFSKIVLEDDGEHGGSNANSENSENSEWVTPLHCGHYHH